MNRPISDSTAEWRSMASPRCWAATGLGANARSGWCLHLTKHRVLYVYAIVLLAAASTRLPHLTVDFIDDEPDWIQFAAQVPFQAGELNLPIMGPYHGPGFVYVARLSSALFGRSPAGYRALGLCAGIALCLVLVAIALQTGDTALGLAAGLISACNPVLIYWSVYTVQLGTFLLLITLAALFLERARATSRVSQLYLCAAMCALSAMTYNMAFAPLGAIVAYCACFMRGAFAPRQWLFAAGVIVVLASPYLVAVLGHGWYQVTDKASFTGVGLNAAVLNLFLDEILPAGMRFAHSVFGYQACDIATGLLSVVGVLAAWTRRREPVPALALTIVAAAITTSMLGLSRGEPRHFNFVVPSVCLLVPFGVMGAASVKRRWLGLALILTVGAFSAASSCLRMPGIFAQRSTLSLAAWQLRGRVDLNDLALATAKALAPPSSVVVIPDRRLDSLANYVTAWSGWPAVGALPDDRILYRWRRSYRDMTILCLTEHQADDFAELARRAADDVSVHPTTIRLGSRELPVLLVRVRKRDPWPPALWREITGAPD